MAANDLRLETLDQILQNLGLGALCQRFRDEKVDIGIFSSLSDADLCRLGVETLGDRIRLREVVSSCSSSASSSSSTVTPSASGSRPSSETPPTGTMASELGSLFGPTRSRFSGRHNKKVGRQRTWTGKFVCLSDKNKSTIPTSAEKMELQKSGLGSKKIQLNSTDDEEKVHKVLCTEFPSIQNCGGVEMLRCGSNCRTLKVIDGKWDVQSLKSFVGGQANIYIRPIQRSISVQTQSIGGKSEIKEVCHTCKKEIAVIEMRKHLEDCETISAPISAPLEMETLIDDHDLLHSSIGNVFVYNEPSENVTVNAPQSVHIYEIAPLLPMEPSVNMAPAIQQGDYILHESVASVHESVASAQESVHEASVQESAHEASVKESVHEASVQESSSTSVQELVEQTIQICEGNNIDEPVEILRLLQKKMVTGRQLDINNEAEILTGETNFIVVDRDDCLKSGIDEIGGLFDLRLCLEVQFYGESAVDLGGPRKEFFTLVLQKIQEKYFDPVKEWSGDYEVIGKIMALSMLQNGKLPRIMTPECISEVFASDTPRPFIRDLKRGLDALGLIQLASRMPSVIHLFTPQTVQLTFRMLSSLLNPQFSQPGSNQILLEKEIYRQFNNYLREAAAGRRQGVNLGSVLRFATGAEEEPVLGFTIPPSLHFVSATSFLPSANTCTNRLNLTIPTGNVQLPSREELFRLYDYGFVNSYFGYE